jgi:hypothetical protein
MFFYCLFESVLEVGGHGCYDFIYRHNTYACLSQARITLLLEQNSSSVQAIYTVLLIKAANESPLPIYLPAASR